MNLQLHEPAPGMDRPIELLRACHRRLAARLDTLERLSGHLAAHGADADAQTAARRVLNYFDQAAPQHHADEDQDLFPLLYTLASHPECHPDLLDTLDRLGAEHDELEADWARLRAAIAQIADGEACALDGAGDWVRRYRAHLETEECFVLPQAELLLTPDHLARIGRSMGERRGIEGEVHA